MQPSYSPDGRYIAATRTTRFGTDVVILDASNGNELLRLTDDGASWAPSWSPAGDAIAFLHIDGPDRRPAAGHARRARRRLDRRRDDRLTGSPGSTAPRGRTGSSRRPSCPRRRRADPAGRRSAGQPDAPVTAPPVTPRRTSTAWPRDRRRPAPSCASGSTRTRRRCPTGSRRDLAGHRAVRPARPRGRRAVRRRGQAQPRLLRGVRVGRASPRSSGSAPRSRPTCPVIADAKRGDIGTTAARQAVALFDGLGADAVTVNPYLGEEAIPPLLERDGPLRLRAVPDVQPRRRRAAGPARRRRLGAGAPAEPLYARVARLAAGWGPGGTVGLVVGATGTRGARDDPRDRARASAFLVPGVGAQGGDVEPVLEHGPATAAPAGGRAGGGLLVNVSRGIAGAAVADRARRRPRRAPRGGRR